MAELLVKPIPVSPISQVLQSIGLTKDDLLRHSDRMRQFLTQHGASIAGSFSSDQQDRASGAGGSSRTRSVSRPNPPGHSQTPSPSTPVKSEPTEPAMPLRQMDSMEMILERKSRQAKREKKAKGKDRPPPSPSPARASFSLDAFMQSRDSRRVPNSDQSDSSSSIALQDAPQNTIVSVPPVTPQHKKYYRDYDSVEPPSRHKKTAFVRPLSPTPTRSRPGNMSIQAHSAPQDADPFTPRRTNYYKSPLPSSSPPRSSPFATPSTKRIVNIVSSPGPMGPLPDEDDYDRLPYKLPPGPYSKRKPELSYAALIGQAILSSPEHRLTLQEIYDWITIVYPYFQRNEATWMNSIRHVLSTTVCFRKVPRDRSLGRTQWAIWDCDLECFANGNFRKEFCAEYKQAAAAKKPATKKRPAEDTGPGRKVKRLKKGPASSVEMNSPAVPTMAPPLLQGSMLPPLVPTAHFLPIFPPYPSVHHQPYYEQCTQLPAEVIFPPLPPTSHYARITSGTATGGTSLPPSSALKSSDVPQASPIPPSSSLPELIPNNGSSSSPQLLSDDHLQTDTADAYIDSTSPEEPAISKEKQKECVTSHKTPPKKPRALPPIPVSPTLDRRTRARKKATTHTPPLPLPALVPEPTATAKTSMHPRLSTPPSRPITPPRNRAATDTAHLSPLRTPLSHKGLYMTPNASLAHFKTHLDPPPHATFNPDDGINPAVFDTENVRTPSRKRFHHRDKDRDALPTHFPPATPKKLVFPAPGSTVESPFRTPGSRIFDPHDPGALLEEEFARLGARATQESPVGLYDRRGLLYESPNVHSPGKLPRWC